MTQLTSLMNVIIEQDMKALRKCKTSNTDYFEGRIRVAIMALEANGDIDNVRAFELEQEMIAVIDEKKI